MTGVPSIFSMLLFAVFGGADAAMRQRHDDVGARGSQAGDGSRVLRDAAHGGVEQQVGAGRHVVHNLQHGAAFVLAAHQESAQEVLAEHRNTRWQVTAGDVRRRATQAAMARIAEVLIHLLAPILPHTAQQLHEYLGYDGQPFGSAQGRLFGTQHVIEVQEETRSHQALTYDHNGAVGTWTKSELPPGQPLRAPAPLLEKLDESVIEDEYARKRGDARGLVVEEDRHHAARQGGHAGAGDQRPPRRLQAGAGPGREAPRQVRSP